MSDDRGLIKRVSFEILYPTGQLKQVHIPIGGVAKWENAGMIAWNHELIRDVLAPALDMRGNTDALDRWESLDGHFKPAMLVVNSDGSVIQFCGNHVKVGGSALWPDDPDAYTSGESMQATTAGAISR